MAYYDRTSYKERFFFVFKDIKEYYWRVSIEDPNSFDGSAVELTPSANPLEWSGSNGESLTDCILGTTGYIRLMCMPGQEDLFKIGTIRPNEVNNRRVIARRGKANPYGTNWRSNSTVMWQGFLTCEGYSQDWDAAPYEVELPMKSSVAILEDINFVNYAPTNMPTDIAGLLRFVVGLTGCDIFEIHTNIADYEDFFGNTQKVSSASDSANAHWTQGQIVYSHWQDVNNDCVTGKTLKEVVEDIVYPLGKLREFGTRWGIFMPCKATSTKNTGKWYLAVDATTNRLTYLESMSKVNLSDIKVLSTSNNLTILPQPKSVKVTRNYTSTEKIFELSADIIKSSYSPSVDKTILCNKRTRLVDIIDSSDVNMQIFASINFDPTIADKFVRTLDVNYDSSSKIQSFGIVSQLAFKIEDNTSVYFEPMQPVRSRKGYNKLRLTLKEYSSMNNETADATKEYSNIRGAFAIKDVNTGKYINSSHNWVESETPIFIQSRNISGESERTFDFFEDRYASDGTTVDTVPHMLQIILEKAIKYQDEYIWIEPTLEYIENMVYDDLGITQTVKLREGTKYFEKNLDVGGSGDDVNITFKTLCGDPYVTLKGAADVPYNNFSNNPNYIDTLQRESLSISSARLYDNGDEDLDIILDYMVVKDGNKTYIPMSVGLNARDCELNLKLVSTNVN